jgi:integrase/recombinase XerD
MATDASTPFQSVLSSLIEKFLQEKHACRYSYRESIRILRHLNSFLLQEGLTTCELPASIARKWLAKKAHEGARTQAQRITVTRQFSRFLLRLGYSAYLPDCTLVVRNPSTFVPRMLSAEELQKFSRQWTGFSPRHVRLYGISLCRRFSGFCMDADFVSQKS